MRNKTPSAEELARAAGEALTRPSHYGNSWQGAYRTHGLVYAWAENGGDILAESNYATMLRLCREAQAEDPTHESRSVETGDEDVEDAGAQHWATGPVCELFVRVYINDSHEHYTAAFIEAVRCALAIRHEYAVLDEADYSERESAAWHSTVDDALHFAMMDDEFTDLDGREPIINRFWELVTADDSFAALSGGDCDPESVNYVAVAQYWQLARTLHYRDTLLSQ